MKRIYNYIMYRLVIRIFADVSTSTFAHKEAGRITLFDAAEHYKPGVETEGEA